MLSSVSDSASDVDAGLEGAWTGESALDCELEIEAARIGLRAKATCFVDCFERDGDLFTCAMAGESG